MNDLDIIEKYKDKKHLRISNDDSEYLQTRYSDSSCIKESLYRILNNIEIRPTCPICGKPVKFIGKSNKLYNKHCSYACSRKDKEVIQKSKETSIKKYGSYGNRNKYKQTCLEKYGVENVFQIPRIIEEIKNINASCKDTALQKRKQTCLEKYGVEEVLQSDIIRQKCKKTMLEKYGGETVMTSIIKNKYNFNQISNKIKITKDKNKTHNTSKPENESYYMLLEKYKNVIRQYKSELYPYCCDFYLPDNDLYIECNYHWTHGGHPYNEHNIDDIDKVNKWKEKHTKYYDNAIKTWTNYDVNKRKIALQNNLNYIEFWNIQELKEWLI